MRGFVLLTVFIAAFVLCADAKKKRNVAGRTARQSSCAPNEIMCEPGWCVPSYYQCDTQPDCSGGVDEENCPTDCTGENQFQCDNGDCKPVHNRCDGDDNCDDGSDEDGCEDYQCPEGKLKCPNTNLCIQKEWLCDYDDDCGDGWDENPENCQANRL